MKTRYVDAYENLTALLHSLIASLEGYVHFKMSAC